MARWAQGLYQPKHQDKYIGKKTPRYRSSWEWAFMNFCDNNPADTHQPFAVLVFFAFGELPSKSKSECNKIINRGLRNP